MFEDAGVDALGAGEVSPLEHAVQRANLIRVRQGRCQQLIAPISALAIRLTTVWPAAISPILCKIIHSTSQLFMKLSFIPLLCFGVPESHIRAHARRSEEAWCGIPYGKGNCLI